ncbi:DUF6531 domain-containing protein [Arthrobacter sp. KNU-44]|uniref:DUF6531 domain-containing protein n=1 Tax=unclassified Arthrobacter TaxID=235627 RepID=UPI003F44178E
MSPNLPPTRTLSSSALASAPGRALDVNLPPNRTLPDALKTTDDAGDGGVGMAGWGANFSGELGRGAAAVTVDRPAPAGSGDLEGASISLVSSNSGGDTNCAVKTGELYCWGDGWSGQLGNGTRFQSSVTPVKVDMTGVMAGTTITKVVTGPDSVCAIASGKAFCWGNQWVTGGDDYSAVPVAIDTTGVLAGKTVTDIAILDYGACVIADGKPYCWGQEFSGELGNGQDYVYEQFPVAVDVSGVLAGKDVTKLSARRGTVCAIAAGEAYCWGDNSAGQLGNGTTTSSNVPVSVGGALTGMTVTGVSVGEGGPCAIANERAFCWGWGLDGTLGTGVGYWYPNHPFPLQETLPVAVDTSGVLAGKAVTQISTGFDYSCALAEGKPYCWGTNRNSNLGAAVAPDTTAWSPVAIDTSGTVLDGKTLTGLIISGGSTIATYTPPPVGSLSLEVTTGPKITLTSTGNYHSDTAGLYTYFYDTSAPGGPKKIASCTSADTCSWTGVPSEYQSTYIAVVADPYTGDGMAPMVRATSYTVTPPAWTVSLASSGSSLTATTNYSTENSDFSIGIYDQSQDGSPIVGSCATGTSCSITTGIVGHTHIAAAGGAGSTFPPTPLLASSNIVGTAGPTAAFESAGGSNRAELGQCFACTPDPVNTSNGEFFENNTDISIPGRGPGLELKRTYSAQRAPFDGPLGYGWSFNYGLSLNINAGGTVDVHQETGSMVTFTPDTNGDFHAPSQVLAALVHNTDGTWTYTRRATEIFKFTSAGQLSQLSDLNGNATTLARNTAGQVTTATDAAGRTLAFTYTPDGHIDTVTDPAGRVVSYSYDSAGRLTNATGTDSATTGYAYNSLNLITTITDPSGNTTTNAYDTARRVTSQTDRAGGITTFSYAADGTTTIVSPGGRTTAETYTNGQLLKVINGASTTQAATWTYTYDQNTFGTTSVTDPLGHATTSTYDTAGNRLTTTDPATHQSTWTYNTLNEVTTATDPAGTTTTYTYDTAGNPLTVSTPLTGTSQTATTTYGHTDTAHPGDTTTITDPAGHTTTLTHTTAGALASSTDPLGNTTSCTYDVLGQRLTTVTPRGNTTTYTYDGAGRLASETDPLGRTTSYYYDANGNRTTQIDALGQTTTTAYDALNRATTVTSPDFSVATTAYDADGNRTSQTDPAGNASNYTYDALNRLTQSTDPLGRATSYAYDAAGYPVTVTDPAGRTTTNTYDAAGNRAGTSYSGGATPNATFTYTAVGQRATMTDGTGTTTNTYDSLGRLTGVTNGAGQATGYTYDLAGHLTALAYPNGQTVNRAYDGAGHLTGITDWAGHTTTLTPDSDGNTTSIVYGNGVTAAATIDAAGQVGAITDTGPGSTALASFTYTRNPVGALDSATITGITQPAESYTYTSRDQLAAVNTGTYTYDPAGNTTTLATGATLTYDAANQPTGYTTSGTTTAITYDAQGNRLTGPAPAGSAASYTWDQANRLTAANGTTYTYNADGLRTTRTPATGSAQHYAWDTRAGVPLMLTDGTTSYLYDDTGNPIEHIDGTGNTFYYQHDQYGSTRLLTDQTSAVAASYTYDANGNLTTKTGTADTPLRWNGQAQDTDTGLYYLRARYYDPTTTQFLSVDPLTAATGERYNFGSGDPVNRNDPTGMISVGFCLSASAGLFGGGFGEVCVVAARNDVDHSLTVGFTETGGAGVQTPSLALGANLQVSSARTVDQLGGPFTYGGLSVVLGGGFGGGAFGGKSCGAPGDHVVGGELNVKTGLEAFLPTPLPAEIHGGRSNTLTQSSAPIPWSPLMPIPGIF